MARGRGAACRVEAAQRRREAKLEAEARKRETEERARELRALEEQAREAERLAEQQRLARMPKAAQVVQTRARGMQSRATVEALRRERAEQAEASLKLQAYARGRAERQALTFTDLGDAERSRLGRSGITRRNRSDDKTPRPSRRCLRPLNSVSAFPKAAWTWSARTTASLAK